MIPVIVAGSLYDADQGPKDIQKKHSSVLHVRVRAPIYLIRLMSRRNWLFPGPVVSKDPETTALLVDQTRLTDRRRCVERMDPENRINATATIPL